MMGLRETCITQMKEMEEEKARDRDKGRLVGVGNIMVMGMAIQLAQHQQAVLVAVEFWSSNLQDQEC